MKIRNMTIKAFLLLGIFLSLNLVFSSDLANAQVSNKKIILPSLTISAKKGIPTLKVYLPRPPREADAPAGTKGMLFTQVMLNAQNQDIYIKKLKVGSESKNALVLRDIKILMVSRGRYTVLGAREGLERKPQKTTNAQAIVQTEFVFKNPIKISKGATKSFLIQGDIAESARSGNLKLGLLWVEASLKNRKKPAFDAKLPLYGVNVNILGEEEGSGETAQDDEPTPIDSQISIISPKGGEEWETKGEYLIKWRTSANIKNILIKLVAENGVFDSSNPANTESFTYIVPEEFPLGNAKLYVFDADNQGIFGMPENGYIKIIK